MTHSKALTRLVLLILASVTLLLFAGMVSAQPWPNPPDAIDAQGTPTKVSPETPEADPSPQETPPEAGSLMKTDLVWVLVGVLALAGLLLAVGLIVYFLRKAKRSQKASTPAQPAPSANWPCLEVPDVSGGPCHFRLQPANNTIGRDITNDIVITQDLPGWETVSPQHARIYRQNSRWILEDLNAMNGVYINGQRTGRNLLHDGYQVGIGGVTFIFHLVPEKPSQES